MKGRLAAMALVGLVVAGCGAASGSSPQASQHRARVTTTSTIPIQNDEAPVLSNSGNDYESILASLSEYASWLFAHPADGEAATIYASNTALLATARDRLGALAEKSQTYVAPPALFESVRLLTVSDNLYVVRAELTTQDGQTLDSEGEVVSDTGSSISTVDVFLQLGPDGRYKLSSISQAATE